MLRRTVATTFLIGLLGTGVAGVVGGAVVAAGAGTAMAAANPMGQGPPNQNCQAILMAGGTTPGHTSSSPGSPFDEAGFGSQPNGGKGGTAYTNAGAPSQYDVACFQVNQHR
jgi:hypothetical protein